MHKEFIQKWMCSSVTSLGLTTIQIGALKRQIWGSVEGWRFAVLVCCKHIVKYGERIIYSIIQ